MNGDEARKQLGRMVKTARLRKYGTVEDARLAAKISRGAWDHVEKGDPVRDFTLAAVEKALDWPAGRVEEVLRGPVDDAVAAEVEASNLSSNAKAQILRVLAEDKAREQDRGAS